MWPDGTNTPIRIEMCAEHGLSHHRERCFCGKLLVSVPVIPLAQHEAEKAELDESLAEWIGAVDDAEQRGYDQAMRQLARREKRLSALLGELADELEGRAKQADDAMKESAAKSTVARVNREAAALLRKHLERNDG